MIPLPAGAPGNSDPEAGGDHHRGSRRKTINFHRSLHRFARRIFGRFARRATRSGYRARSAPPRGGRLSDKAKMGATSGAHGLHWGLNDSCAWTW
jgi:hypothetical protein